MYRNLLALALPLTLVWGAAAQDQKPAQDKVKPLAGWPRAFPEMMGWSRTSQQPVGGRDGTTYRQTVRYEWTGGAAKRLDVTLARDPAFKTLYDPKALERQDNPPRNVTAGQHPAWLWHLKKPG